MNEFHIISTRPVDNNNRLSEKNDILLDNIIFGVSESTGPVSVLSPFAWLNQLRSKRYENLIFYIHGFNNPPYKKVFPRIENIHRQLSQTMAASFKLVPIFWPTQKDKFPLNDYFSDQRWADQSSTLLAKHLIPVLNDLTETSVHFICHSMGARVMLESIKQNANIKLDKLFLIAPDIDDEALEINSEGHLLPKVFGQITVFHASDDLALKVSKWANIFSDGLSNRLGVKGAENPEKLPSNITFIDSDAYNFAQDNLKGHSYFVSQNGEVSPVIAKIASQLEL